MRACQDSIVAGAGSLATVRDVGHAANVDRIAKASKACDFPADARALGVINWQPGLK